MPPRPTSSRSALLLAICVTFVPILALNLFNAAVIRRQIAEEKRADASNLAEQTAAGVGRDLESTRQLLSALAFDADVRSADLARTAEVLRQFRSTSPLFANLILIDERGDIVASARPMPAAINVADRPYFQRVQENRRMGVGEFMVGRVTGRASLPVACPLPGQEQAGPLRCVLAAVDLEALERSLAAYPLPSATGLVLLDRNGTVLAHRGERLAENHRRFPDWVGIPRSHSMGARDAAGDERVVYFSAVPHTDEGIWVGVAILGSTLEQASTRALLLHLGMASLVVIMAIVGSWIITDRLVLQPIHRISNAATALVGGDWSARAGVVGGTSELRQLGATFDRLVGHLQQQVRPKPPPPLEPPPPNNHVDAEGDRLQHALEAQQMADAVLRHSENTARAFIDSLPESALLIDPAGRILMANPTAATRMHRPLHELVGGSLATVISGELLASRRPHFEEVLRTRHPRSFDDRREDRILHTQLTPVLAPDGKVAAVAVISFDITERHEMEERLRRTIADLGAALAKVKTLSGLLPICAGCKRIRDDRGYWSNVEQYLHEHTEAELSHGLCPECMRRLYPEYADEIVGTGEPTSGPENGPSGGGPV